MNKFEHVFVQFFLSVFILNAVNSQNPTAVFKLTKSKVTMAPNPFFETWVPTPESGGTAISLTLPVKSKIPENMTVKLFVKISDMDIGETDILLCDAIDEPILGKDIAEQIKPKITLESCTIAPNDYKLVKWVFPKEKIPIGMPDGKVIGKLTVYIPDQPPIITIDIEGDLTNKMPGLGR